VFSSPPNRSTVFIPGCTSKKPAGQGTQVYQANGGAGSGGLDRQRLGDSRQKLGFLPEHHTDFIFSIIGKNSDWLRRCWCKRFVAIVMCGFWISLHAPDTFGLLLGFGADVFDCFRPLIKTSVCASALPTRACRCPSSAMRIEFADDASPASGFC